MMATPSDPRPPSTPAPIPNPPTLFPRINRSFLVDFDLCRFFSDFGMLSLCVCVCITMEAVCDQNMMPPAKFPETCPICGHRYDHYTAPADVPCGMRVECKSIVKHPDTFLVPTPTCVLGWGSSVWSTSSTSSQPRSFGEWSPTTSNPTEELYWSLVDGTLSPWISSLPHNLDLSFTRCGVSLLSAAIQSKHVGLIDELVARSCRTSSSTSTSTTTPLFPCHLSDLTQLCRSLYLVNRVPQVLDYVRNDADRAREWPLGDCARLYHEHARKYDPEKLRRCEAFECAILALIEFGYDPSASAYPPPRLFQGMVVEEDRRRLESECQRSLGEHVILDTPKMVYRCVRSETKNDVTLSLRHNPDPGKVVCIVVDMARSTDGTGRPAIRLVSESVSNYWDIWIHADSPCLSLPQQPHLRLTRYPWTIQECVLEAHLLLTQDAGSAQSNAFKSKMTEAWQRHLEWRKLVAAAVVEWTGLVPPLAVIVVDCLR